MEELSLGLVRADIIMSRQALEYYKKHTKIKDIKNVCAYHIQQSVEKLIKYQIQKSGITYNYSKIRTHNILFLINYAKSIGVCLNVPDFIVINAERISSREAGSRYDIHFSIRIDTLEKFINVIEAWYSGYIKTHGKK